MALLNEISCIPNEYKLNIWDNGKYGAIKPNEQGNYIFFEFKYEAKLNITSAVYPKEYEEFLIPITYGFVSFWLRNRRVSRSADSFAKDYFTTKELYVLYVHERKSEYFDEMHKRCSTISDSELETLFYEQNFVVATEKELIDKSVQDIFRKKIQAELKKRYKFFAMTARPGVDASTVIKANFKDLIGRLSAPYDDRNVYSLAVPLEDMAEDDSGDKGGLMNILYQYFDIKDCEPGSDPLDVVTPIVRNKHVELDDIVLVGCVKSDEHWEWIKDTGVYNVPLVSRGEHAGAKSMTREMMMVRKVMLYKYNKSSSPEPEYLGIFELSDPNSLPLTETLDALQKKSVNVDYPVSPNRKDPQQRYFTYDINVETDAEPILKDVAKEWVKQMVANQTVKGEAEYVRRVEIRR